MELVDTLLIISLSKFIIKVRGILDNTSGVVNICVNILTNTLHGISLNTLVDEYKVVSIFTT